MDIDSIGSNERIEPKPEREGWGRYISRKAVDYGTSLGASLATAYTALGLTDISRFNSDFNFELSPYKVAAITTASMAVGYGAHRLVGKAYTLGEGWIKKNFPKLAEDADNRGSHFYPACGIILACTVASGLVALSGKLPYPNSNPSDLVRSVFVRLKTETRDRNKEFFKYYLNPFTRIRAPRYHGEPDESGGFPNSRWKSIGNIGGETTLQA